MGRHADAQRYYATALRIVPDEPSVLSNLGLSYAIPGQGVTLAADLLNVYQSKGLEEGNPRLPSAGGRDLFLARPILPLRFTLNARYQF